MQHHDYTPKQWEVCCHGNAAAAGHTALAHAPKTQKRMRSERPGVMRSERPGVMRSDRPGVMRSDVIPKPVDGGVCRSFGTRELLEIVLFQPDLEQREAKG